MIPGIVEKKAFSPGIGRAISGFGRALAGIGTSAGGREFYRAGLRGIKSLGGGGPATKGLMTAWKNSPMLRQTVGGGMLGGGLGGMYGAYEGFREGGLGGALAGGFRGMATGGLAGGALGGLAGPRLAGLGTWGRQGLGNLKNKWFPGGVGSATQSMLPPSEAPTIMT
jgi:hypothetical protein